MTSAIRIFNLTFFKTPQACVYAEKISYKSEIIIDQGRIDLRSLVFYLTTLSKPAKEIVKL